MQLLILLLLLLPLLQYAAYMRPFDFMKARKNMASTRLACPISFTVGVTISLCVSLSLKVDVNMPLKYSLLSVAYNASFSSSLPPSPSKSELEEPFVFFTKTLTTLLPLLPRNTSGRFLVCGLAASTSCSWQRSERIVTSA